ncbi:MAG: cation transporter [Blastocatellia bacterium]|nr:cation transporter [Blastocatellia bacterium]
MNAQIGSASNESYRRGVRRVLIVTLALNLAVVAGKLAAGLLAGSLSVISDAIHSSVDSLNNIVGLVVMKFATAEPDEDHPYGHAKFETLAAFAIAGFLFVTCYQIALSAIRRVLAHNAPAPEITALTIGVMVGTIIFNIFVTVYERREGRRLQSAFLIADSAHTRSDVMVSCSVLAGLILIRSGHVWLDPIISLGVAAVIALTGYQIFKATVPVLVDAAHAPAWRIAEIVRSVPGVHSAHDIRSRSQGGEIFVEMHLHVANEFERDHIASHAITEEIERRLAAEFGRVTATIHVEPLPE